MQTKKHYIGNPTNDMAAERRKWLGVMPNRINFPSKVENIMVNMEHNESPTQFAINVYI